MHKPSEKLSERIPYLMAGAAVLAFGMYNIHSRCSITEGGVLGMTLFIRHWFGITPGITGFIMDATCYFLGYKILGKEFLKSAVTASAFFSLFYNTFEFLGPMFPDLSPYPLASAIVGGLFIGVGAGLVVRQGGASGGDDALGLIISRLTGCSIAKAYLITDLSVLSLSLTYIPFSKIFYSLITVTISSETVDIIQNIEFKRKSPKKEAEI